MFPEGIPSGAYTHLNFAFAFVDPESFSVAPMKDSDVPLYTRFTGLKASDPGLQTWISVGGWSMNDPDQPTAGTFSKLAGSTGAQSAFFTSLLSFLSTYGFDGVDIDWSVPNLSIHYHKVLTTKLGSIRWLQNALEILKTMQIMSRSWETCDEP